MSKSVVTKSPTTGHSLNWNQYLVSQSEVIANLILEHQWLHQPMRRSNLSLERILLLEESKDPEQRRERLARRQTVSSNTLFSVTKCLPNQYPSQIPGLQEFSGKGNPLRQLNLKDRLMERCSYMIDLWLFKDCPGNS